jgi:basic membrane lipoprotein Med (substrate-binding protein (PBP1-ABC) superfamily)
MQRHLGSDWVLASATFEWQRGFEAVVQAVLENVSYADSNGLWLIKEGLDTGLVDFTPPTIRVPDNVRTRVTAMITQIKENTLKVFTGPILNSTGEVVVPAGTYIPDEDVSSITWLISGLT